jgi:hypothetical protein
VYNSCSAKNWDGYDAMPVKKKGLDAVRSIIESLPTEIPMPSISAEPAGFLTLEWYKSPCRTLSVSVDPDGWLHYAGLYGLNRRYGTFELTPVFPEELIQHIRELDE